MNSAAIRMDSNLTSMWVSFFTTAGIPSDVAATYALTFTENRIQNDMLLDLNKEYLRDMGISRMGDVIAILRHAKQVHESTARDRVLSTTAIKVPVAAVTGRATVAQPSSPASRMLEHYTRNTPPQESSPVKALKRKSIDIKCNTGDLNVKKARMIRFGTPPNEPVKKVAVPVSKQTVFARLGSSGTEPVALATVRTTSNTTVRTTKPDAKPIFSRLGSKTDDDLIKPMKDALKYEGILKGNPTFNKTVTVTTSKNNIRKIACTMRADEAPMSVKEKLALPKAKSVKFSNTIQYKEIEAIQKSVNGKPKFTPVFNKPERRLSMPEGSGNVKARLGMKTATNLTITKNVFNRLGV